MDEEVNKSPMSHSARDDQIPCTMTDQQAWEIGYNENQGIHLVLGAQYIRSSKKLDKWYWNFYNIGLTINWLFLSRAALLLFDDLQLLFEVTHWWVIASAAMLVTHMAPKENYDRIFTCLGKGIYTYKILDKETFRQVKEMRARCRKEITFLSKGFTVSVLGTLFGFLVLMPLMNILSGEFTKPQLSNGLVKGVPAILWIPFDVGDEHIVLTRILIVIFEGYTSFVIVNMVIGQQTTTLCFGHTLYHEFQILALTFENVEKRAISMRTEAVNTRSKAINDRLLMCLKDSVQHHIVLLKIVKDYVRIFSRQELVTLLTSTFIICLSAITISSDIELGPKLIAVVFVGVEMVNVFVVCYFGQVLLNAHDVVQMGIYSSDWTSYSTQLQKSILIVLTRLQKQLEITAAGFVPVNLDTFAQVVKTAFSYFSLLQALKT